MAIISIKSIYRLTMVLIAPTLLKIEVLVHLGFNSARCTFVQQYQDCTCSDFKKAHIKETISEELRGMTHFLQIIAISYITNSIMKYVC